MIKLLRVDERFVHGQVAFAWTNNLGANCIFVASNEIATNNLRKKTLKMAVPTGTKFVVKDMTEAISVLNGEKNQEIPSIFNCRDGGGCLRNYSART
ncbi:PTS sugar transporter subunit IIB (plasmid) [Enterococcus faecium]